MSKKNNTIKRCQVDTLKNDFNCLYSRYKFLCCVDSYLYDFADGDFEAFADNFLFFLKSINCDFIDLVDEFNSLLEECKE